MDLIAPESDDNPWHYKINWNPANVVKAGSFGAIFKDSGEIRKVAYKDIFQNAGLVQIKPVGEYAWYPNRDSMIYIPVYGLESAQHFYSNNATSPGILCGLEKSCKRWINR